MLALLLPVLHFFLQTSKMKSLILTLSNPLCIEHRTRLSKQRGNVGHLFLETPSDRSDLSKRNCRKTCKPLLHNSLPSGHPSN